MDTVWGELLRPPASSKGAIVVMVVVVVVTPIPTGGLCWKILDVLGTGRQWHSKGCREMPRQHHCATARSHPGLLQRFGLLCCG